MILDAIKIFFKTRHQTISHIPDVQLPDTYRGVPVLDSSSMSSMDRQNAASLCPAGAIDANDFSLDMGKCLFCGECAKRFPENIKFTSQWRIWAYNRSELKVTDKVEWSVPNPVTPCLKYRNSLRIREVCAGGDMGCELELGACQNVNFDMQRYGMEITASPRHADALLVTGPVTRNMASALEDAYNAMSGPKLLVAVGTDAISGGLFSDSNSVDRSFFSNHTPDLYIAGSPAHPLNIISALAALTGRTLR